MPVVIKRDSLDCFECGTEMVLKGDWYECPNCGAFKDKKDTLVVTYGKLDEK